MIILPREIKAILAFTSSNKKMLNFYRQFMLTAKTQSLLLQTATVCWLLSQKMRKILSLQIRTLFLTISINQHSSSVVPMTHHCILI